MRCSTQIRVLSSALWGIAVALVIVFGDLSYLWVLGAGYVVGTICSALNDWAEAERRDEVRRG